MFWKFIFLVSSWLGRIFFGRRRKWNGKVAMFFETFDLTIKEVRVLDSLEALDLVYPKGFSPEEGALYLAYLAYSTFLKENDPRAEPLKEKIRAAEDDWIQRARVNPNNVASWQKKAAEWEAQAKKERFIKTFGKKSSKE